MIKIRFLALAALALLLGACTQDELADDNRLSKEEYPIVIHATGLSVEAAPSTRASVDGDWQGVNSVALKIGDAVKEYTVTATDADGYKSATLSRENDPYYWISRNPITVSAWWPLDDTNITQMPVVKVAEDQSILADFQNSDFISAENQTVKFDDPTLGFTHRTARVAIELKPGTGFTSVAGVTVSLVSLSADNGNPTAIKTHNASGNTYEALTAPQTVAAGKPFVKVELGSGTFYFRPQNDVVLEAGNRYSYTVKVNANGLTLEGCTIGSWADGRGESGAAEDLGYSIQNDGSYTVYNANGLMNVAELVNGGKTDINITLTADIDLTGKGWTPIGTDYDNSYTGTFDGGGHTITGLTVTTNDEYAGLFGYLGNFNNGAATVKNVVMDGIQITCNHRLGYAGGVAGFSWGTIENCSVSGSISGTVSVGGVVGVQRDHPITGCSSSATVKGTINVGGVAGQTIFGATLTACYATGNVIIEIDRTENISGGGLVGFNDGSLSLLSCYATGNVTSTGSSTGYVHIGGFLGDNYITLTACYWKNNHEQGIGYNRESTKATKVDGSGVTWQKAVDAMNTALQNAGSEWRYELNGALPTLRKQ
ncbi:fimbrillin family protein [Prevotella copri]|uniref:fimbrillin family protein n=1 Tax=Segatella copri TaxID=165179 RepID=UPI001291E6BE|nr:fimbrillin family protein [Segatella copri]MQO76680.1 fimbrillin family protein [Segatella copri]